jgi:hypothetical protein
MDPKYLRDYFRIKKRGTDINYNAAAPTADFTA